VRSKERTRHFPKIHGSGYKGSGLQRNDMFVYLDDIVIYAAEHQTKFHKFAERLRQANLKLQPDKCEFLRKEVNYLGHVIGICDRQRRSKTGPIKDTSRKRIPATTNQ